MNRLRLDRYAPTASVVIALLAGCGALRPPMGAPGALPQGRSISALSDYTSLYSFKGEPDGVNPQANLLLFNGVLYGITSAGGVRCLGVGCGTVFKITTEGVETVLHRFQGVPADGAEPMAGLTPTEQGLYGTTDLGGVHCGTRKVSQGCGTVYNIRLDGTERVVYRFAGLPDGAYPQGPVTRVGDYLYGTTSAGGLKCAYSKFGCGTVYALGPSGKERVIYRFQGEPDGAAPTGNLLLLDGMLYGTTLRGGAHDEGTVFAIYPSGGERIIYSSAGGIDMEVPSSLVAVNDVLYGCSIGGGTHNGGTVYSVTTVGYERVVHSFGQLSPYGTTPYGKLLAVNGTLYGATNYGGDPSGDYGLLFSLTTSGTFKVQYRFRGEPDGSSPYGGMTDDRGTFYGTTLVGGARNNGTVFRFSPKV